MPDYVNRPEVPIARLPGHLPGCYDSARNYRSCERGCPASAAWRRGGPDVEAAHDAHDRDVADWLSGSAGT